MEMCVSLARAYAAMHWELGGETMSKVIDAVYENGVFRPLEPVLLPEGEHVQVHVPEQPPPLHTRLAALDAFEAVDEELTEDQLF